MMSDILSEGVLVATAALLSMPIVAQRFRRAFQPAELTRYNSATMSTGLALLLLALVACAIPVAGALFGLEVTDRHFFPGESVVGWVSAFAASALVVSGVVGYRRLRAVEDRLVVEPTLGLHIDRGRFDLVVLPNSRRMAYAVGGNAPQVVVTTGVIDALSVTELASVVEHESAHISMKHRFHLTIIAMIEPLAALLWPARRLVDAARMALEYAADSATTDRAATQSALLRLSGVSVGHGIAAFTAGDIAGRLTALSTTQPSLGTATRVYLYIVAVALGLVSVVALGMFWF